MCKAFIEVEEIFKLKFLKT